jgi:hypothetical protein
LGYTETGAISGLLAEKAIINILIPHYSDVLVKVAIQYNINIIKISQTKEWYKLRVYKVHLIRYFDNPEGLKLTKEEIETI